MLTLSILIKDMHCERCVRAVEDALRQLTGLAACEVTVGSANVRFDESVTKRGVVLDAIRRAGPFEISGFTVEP